MTTSGGGAGTATTAGGGVVGTVACGVAGHVLAGNAPPDVVRTSGAGTA